MTEHLEDHVVQLGWMVIDAAKDVFIDCGAEDDFCVQHVTPVSAVFGGTNRVIWTPANGFRIDESFCTSRFKARWSERS